MNIGIIASQETGDGFVPPIVNIPLNGDGGWYYPYEPDGVTPKPFIKNIKPGSIIQVTSDISYALLYGLQGTSQRPIRIVPVGGPWRFYQGGASYAANLKANHVIIDGGPSKNLIFGAASGAYSPQTLTINGSSNIEVTNCILEHGEVGLLGNPSTGPNMYDVHIHHNIIRDMRNPGATCEGIYLGNTSLQTITGTHFENLKVHDNEIYDIGGDGIQISNAQNYHVYNNTITDYGIGNVPDQRTGLIIGSNSWGIVEDNAITRGTGGGMQCFGTGVNTFQNNILTDVASVAGEDAIYIRKNGIDGDPLQCNILNNQIVAVSNPLAASRHGVFHPSETPPRYSVPGTWSGNTIGSVGGQAYRSEIVPPDNITP